MANSDNLIEKSISVSTNRIEGVKHNNLFIFNRYFCISVSTNRIEGVKLASYAVLTAAGCDFSIH